MTSNVILKQAITNKNNRQGSRKTGLLVPVSYFFFFFFFFKKEKKGCRWGDDNSRGEEKGEKRDGMLKP